MKIFIPCYDPTRVMEVIVTFRGGQRNCKIYN